MWDDLAGIDHRFAYRDERTRYIAFPLGGIGAGGLSISGSGRLIDWSIRNRPALQGYNGYSPLRDQGREGRRARRRPRPQRPLRPQPLRRAGPAQDVRRLRPRRQPPDAGRRAALPRGRLLRPLPHRRPRLPRHPLPRRRPPDRLLALHPAQRPRQRHAGRDVRVRHRQQHRRRRSPTPSPARSGTTAANSGDPHLRPGRRHQQPAPDLVRHRPAAEPQRGDLTIATDADGGRARRPPLPRPVVRQPRRLLEGVRPPRPAAAAPLRRAPPPPAT